MKAYRTIRYRLHPQTQAKTRKLHELAGACRYVWNHFVGVLRDEYTAYGRADSRWYSLLPRFTHLRKQVPWLQGYSSGLLRLSLKPIETTYRQFYKGEGGLPKFHGRYSHVPFIPLDSQRFKLQGNWLHVQKIGQLKLTGNNPYTDGIAKSGTIKYEAGRWYAYIVYEVQVTALPASIKPVGMDRNVGQMTRSDGVVHHTPEMGRLEARKRRYQRMMARRHKGSRKQGIKPSNRYLKAKHLCACTHQKIVQARTNWCHQTSREIADKYNLVYMEDLNTKSMTVSAKGTTGNPGKHVKRKAGLNKAILSSGWHKLEHCLSYKSNVVKVAPHYTSQACHECGHTDKQNRKSQSKFECVECGHRANADMNAALNILAFGNGAAGRGGRRSSGPVKRQTVWLDDHVN
ncbi:MAG: transposase [Gammaproteobacteria bacterium]|nr:transposase [Gammaproteobacteria bacterium]